MRLDRLFAKISLGVDRGLDNEGWVKERDRNIVSDSARGPTSRELVEAANRDVHTVRRWDPERGELLPDHGASIDANRRANGDLLRTLWSGHQLGLARKLIQTDGLSGGAAAWAWSLACFREMVGFPVLAALALAENRGHIHYHRQKVETQAPGVDRTAERAKGKQPNLEPFFTN